MPYTQDPSDFQLAPEGKHECIVWGWQDKGMQDSRFGSKHRAILKYESLSHTMDNGTRFSIFDFLNVALGDNATLTARRRAILGKPLTKEQQYNFDPNELMGMRIGVHVIHETSEHTGREYLNIVKIEHIDANREQNKAELENEVQVTEQPPTEDEVGYDTSREPLDASAGQPDYSRPLNRPSKPGLPSKPALPQSNGIDPVEKQRYLDLVQLAFDKSLFDQSQVEEWVQYAEGDISAADLAEQLQMLKDYLANEGIKLPEEAAVPAGASSENVHPNSTGGDPLPF